MRIIHSKIISLNEREINTLRGAVAILDNLTDEGVEEEGLTEARNLLADIAYTNEWVIEYEDE